ncbi:MAG: hypothetical protein MHMPM18_003508, partial [Marteilia pararefringens]
MFNWPRIFCTNPTCLMDAATSKLSLKAKVEHMLGDDLLARINSLMSSKRENPDKLEGLRKLGFEAKEKMRALNTVEFKKISYPKYEYGRVKYVFNISCPYIENLPDSIDAKNTSVCYYALTLDKILSEIQSSLSRVYQDILFGCHFISAHDNDYQFMLGQIGSIES